MGIDFPKARWADSRRETQVARGHAIDAARPEFWCQFWRQLVFDFNGVN